jgi:hypothetical protein
MNLLTPQFIIPLALITPYMMIGRVSISLVDIIVVLGSAVLLVNSKFRVNRAIFIFLTTFFTSWIISKFNGSLSWGTATTFGDLRFFIKILYFYSAFMIGFSGNGSIDELLKSRFLLFSLVLVAFLSFAYMFLNGADRYLMLMFWYDNLLELKQRVISDRFPGMAVNINIFSFMVSTIFIFSSYLFLKERKFGLIAILSFLIVLFGQSKKSISICIITLFIYMLYFLFINDYSKFIKIKYGKIKLRYMSFMVLLLMIIIILISAFTFSKSTYFQHKYRSFSQVIIYDIDDVRNPIMTRYMAWSDGIKRIKLAPILGIPTVLTNEYSEVLSFAHPHNEFLQVWMFYGLLGLISFLGLLVYAFSLNIRRKSELSWIIFYSSVVIQMMVDTAFFGYQFVIVFFILFGINLKEFFIRKQIRNSLRSDML